MKVTIDVDSAEQQVIRRKAGMLSRLESFGTFTEDMIWEKLNAALPRDIEVGDVVKLRRSYPLDGSKAARQQDHPNTRRWHVAGVCDDRVWIQRIWPAGHLGAPFTSQAKHYEVARESVA